MRVPTVTFLQTARKPIPVEYSISCLFSLEEFADSSQRPISILSYPSDMSRREAKSTFEAMLDELDSSSASDDSDGNSSLDSDEEMGRVVKVCHVAEPKLTRGDSTTNRPSFHKSASKLDKTEQDIANFGKPSRRRSSVETAPAKESVNADGVEEMKRWLSRPCRPDDPAIMCYIERSRNGLGQVNNVYRCYLESSKAVDKVRGGRSEEEHPAKFLMSAKKRTGSKTSNYLITTDLNPTDDRGSFSVLGKLRSDAFGSRYTVVDGGLAPEKCVTPSTLRKELGLVQFQFDSGGPSVIHAWVPYMNSSGMQQVWYPQNTLIETDHMDMRGAVDGDKWKGKLLQLVNVKPKWDNVRNVHVLDFQGRISNSSKKNFQLCCPELPSANTWSERGETTLNPEVVLQFVKAGKDKFSMDVRYPLSIYTAFAICIACLDGKLGDRKGLEMFSGIRNLSPKKKGEPEHSHSDEAVCMEGSVDGASKIGGGVSSAHYLRDKFYRVLK